MLIKITIPVFLHQNVRHISRWTAQKFIIITEQMCHFISLDQRASYTETIEQGNISGISDLGKVHP